MLQSQADEAQRLRGELDKAQAQLAEALQRSALEARGAHASDAAAVELVRTLQREGDALRQRCREAATETGAFRLELGALQQELSAQRRATGQVQHPCEEQPVAHRLRAELVAAQGQLAETSARLKAQE